VGALEKLFAAVRPEFRADLIDIDAADPVFGGPPCRVAGCPRPGRAHGLCKGHRDRWAAAGRPDVAQFAAATKPTMHGHSPLPACLAEGCRFGQHSSRLCSWHSWAWRRAGKPDLATWAATAPWKDPGPAATQCRVSYCDLLARPTAPLCESHARHWVAKGKPDLAEFVHGYDVDKPQHEQLNVAGLDRRVKLEMQYALQCRRDEGHIRTPPSSVRHTAGVVARAGVESLLDWSREEWRAYLLRRYKAGGAVLGLITYACDRLEGLLFGRGWDIEYPRDVWRLRNLGVDPGNLRLRFDRITQPWLRELAKRWIRWRIGTGIASQHAVKCVAILTSFGTFLASPSSGGVERLADVDRAVLERYLAWVRTLDHGHKSRSEHVGLVNAFLVAIRQHRWDDTLPATAIFFAEDFPPRPQELPRALAEAVMAQVEHPDNLNRWPDPAGRLVTQILIRCGLRVGDAVRLPFDCIARDADSAPYLRYFNHKMKREALVPIDDEIERGIIEQQQRVLARWPQGSPVLFARLRANITGNKALSTSTYRQMLNAWLTDCDVRDQHGQRVHLTPHHWRHTLGTRLINRDVPQEVVRRILDHDSHAMTSHYARLSETTVRRHWEQARKVDINGDTVTLDPAGPLADAAWAKQRLGRVTQALPNGYCGLPLQQTCPHANACLTCPMFITTAEFLPQHRQQRQQLLQIVSVAHTRGQSRMAEMNQQVIDNLDRIITSLGADGLDADAGVTDAS